MKLPKKLILKLLLPIVCVLFLQDESLAEPNPIIWGQEQHGVKIGCRLSEWPPTPNGDISIYLLPNFTNYWNGIYFARQQSQRVNIVLRGVEPNLTTKSFGDKIPKKISELQKSIHKGEAAGNDLHQLAMFKLDQIFTIRKEGLYQLEVTAQMYIPSSNTCVPIQFDPVIVKFYPKTNSDLQPMIYLIIVLLFLILILFIGHCLARDYKKKSLRPAP